MQQQHNKLFTNYGFKCSRQLIHLKRGQPLAVGPTTPRCWKRPARTLHRHIARLRRACPTARGHCVSRPTAGACGPWAPHQRVSSCESSQENSALPSRRLTRLWASHIQTESSPREPVLPRATCERVSARRTANARRDCEDSPRWALVQRSPEVFSTVAARVEPAQHVQEGGGCLALGGGGPLGEVSSERVHLTSKRVACPACGCWVERERRARTSVQVWRPSSSRSGGHGAAGVLGPGLLL